jgi:signal transduction histidine kinase
LQQPTILVISDDAEFSRALTGRWQSERRSPSFTLVSSDVCLGFDPEGFHLAIVGRIRPQALSVVMEVMQAADKRVIFVSGDARAQQTVHNRWPGVVVMQEQENWLDTLVMVSSEAIQGAVSKDRARRAELCNIQLERQATLGRYMLEMRHNLNNALTSVLGNSELLLLEPGSLSAGSRSQIETIRNMSLRMHEVLQRFSSLEKELNVAAEQPATEPASRTRAATASQ